MTNYDGTTANVIAYANPFPSKPRIEILVDWNDISRWKNSERLSFDVYAVAQPTPPATADRSGWKSVKISLGNRFLSDNLWSQYHEQFLSAFDGISEQGPTVRLENFLSIGSHGGAHTYDLAEAPHPFFDVTEPRVLDKKPENVNLKYAVFVKRLLDWRHKLHNLTNQNLSRTDSAAISAVSRDDRLGAVRHACRDEVTFGHSLNVLHFFDLSESTGPMKQFLQQPILWLVALPVDSLGNFLSSNEFVPVPTRLVSDGTHLITYLEEMTSQQSVQYENAYKSFWAKTVAVRQLISAEISEHEPTTPREVLQVIERHSLAPSLSIKALREAAKNLVRKEGMAEAEIARQSGEIVEGVRTAESGTVPYDKIGICWDRTSVMPRTSPDYHLGYKGYRLDVFSDDGEKPQSLCAASIRVTTPSNVQFELRESKSLGITEGYVDITVQKDPTSNAPAPASGFNDQELALARDFSIYDGYSAVAKNPLDCLVKINTTNEPTPVVVTLENLPLLSYKLRYGNKLGIRVRKLGMTGMGPEPGNTEPAHSDWIVFKRTVYMRPPEIQSAGKRLLPASTKAKENSSGTQAIVRIDGSDPEIVLKLRYPTVHWKVAWHARGDLADIVDPDFQSVCEAFARRGVAQQTDATKSVSGDYLRAVDPHIKGVQILTRIWYPFSDNRSGNRYVITGRRSFAIEASKISFPQLVVKAEKRIDDQSFDIQSDVPVAYPKPLSYQADHIPDPVVVVGHRNQVECSGEWDEKSSFQIEDKLMLGLDFNNKAGDKRALIEATRGGVTPWVWNLIVHPPRDSDRPKIGGHAGNPPEPIISIHYAGLKTRHLERWLPVPPTKGSCGNVSSVPDGCAAASNTISCPARGTTFQWRNFIFPSKDKPIASSLRSNYVDFVLGMLGPAEIVDGKKDGSEKLSVRIIPNDKSDRFVAPGFNFPSPVRVAEIDSGPSGYDAATLGQFSIQTGPNQRSERKLPFIEDDITWVVRLEWRFPIRGAHVERPYDLAAVKEFRIYRTNSGEKPDSKTPPIGFISRPSETTLQTYNLDEVSWVFFDALRDREMHRFSYHVQAVPEDEGGFQSAFWALFTVVVPNSQFDKRPEPSHILPMFPVENLRRVAIRVPASRESLLAWRLSAIKQDPLLPTPPTSPQVKVISSNFKEALALESTLMESCSSGLSQPGMDELFPKTQPLSEAIYQNRPSEPFKKLEEGWQFGANAVEDSSSTTVWIQELANMPRGNPFFKLQVTLYDSDENKYPRLEHTAPSEILQTEWVQSYPDDLQFSAAQTKENLTEIGIENSWKYGGPTSEYEKPAGASMRYENALKQLLRYRYHFFAAEQSRPEYPNAAFHLSTFYYSRPTVPIALLRPKIQVALRRFLIDDLSELRTVDIYVVAEEGLMAPTYSIDDNGVAQTSAERIFLALRSSKAAMTLPLSLWT